MTSYNLAMQPWLHSIGRVWSMIEQRVCSLVFVQSSSSVESVPTTIRARPASGHVIHSVRSADTGEPGFYCAGCDDALFRIRTWDDPENRQWAEMLTHWLNEHDPNRRMGRP